MNKKAEKYTSPLIEKLMEERNPVETAKTRNRMLLAVKIDDAIKAKGWKKKDLANALNKKPSVITKWLSGTHNFTSDTLTEIELILDVKLLNPKPEEVVIKYQIVVKQEAERGWGLTPELDFFLKQNSFSSSLTAKC